MSNTKDNKTLLDRRDALRVFAGGAAAGILSGVQGKLLAQPEQTVAPILIPASGPGHVVKVHLPGMKDVNYPHQAAAKIAVDKAVCTLAGEEDVGRAWSRFISSTDRVGIKVNCLGTRLVSTMREVTMAIAQSVRDIGVEDANILIFDMFASNMMGGRYDQQPIRRKMRILAHREYEEYERPWVKAGPARVKFSKLMDWCTAIINVPPIKDHDLAGVTCTMKNMTFGTVEKPHVNHHVVNEACAHLYALEEIRGKVRLNIIDGTSILYDGGPKANRSALTTHDCIYASTDPVAMDAVAFELIANLRAENNMRTLSQVGRHPSFLKLGQELGLGIADRSKIHLETVTLPPFKPSV